MGNQTTVTVKLRRTYGYGGKYYGPGESVEVPIGLADSLGLSPRRPPTDPDAPSQAPGASSGGAKKPDTALPKIHALEAHLASLKSIDEVRELQARDTRLTAQAMYDARIQALGG